MGTGPVRGLRAAVSFLSRIPTGPPGATSSDFAHAVPWFPVAGALIGLALAGSYASFLAVFPPVPAAGLCVGVSLLLTGALHEDGLADTADAFGGGRSREEILGILKDPAHGTYGVLALVVSVGLRMAAMAELDAWTAVAVLPAAHALSRGGTVAVMGVVPPAIDDGLGASYAALITRREVIRAIAAALVVGFVAVGVWLSLAVPAVVIGAAAIAWISVRRIGGITGDVLGAVQQTVEILLMLLGAAAVAGGWVLWWR
jgi:adenosylcobinamide-GDP ribazoletransferase